MLGTLLAAKDTTVSKGKCLLSWSLQTSHSFCVCSLSDQQEEECPLILTYTFSDEHCQPIRPAASRGGELPTQEVFNKILNKKEPIVMMLQAEAPEGPSYSRILWFSGGRHGWLLLCGCQSPAAACEVDIFVFS